MKVLTTTAPIMRVVPDQKPRINLYEYRLVQLAADDLSDEHLESGLQAIRVYGRLALGRCLDDETTAYRNRRLSQQATAVLRVVAHS